MRKGEFAKAFPAGRNSLFSLSACLLWGYREELKPCPPCLVSLDLGPSRVKESFTASEPRQTQGCE